MFIYPLRWGKVFISSEIFGTNNFLKNDGGKQETALLDIWGIYLTMKLKNDFGRITGRIVIYVGEPSRSIVQVCRCQPLGNGIPSQFLYF